MKTQVCAWCEAQGIATVLQFGDEPEVSHGICHAHAMQLDYETAQRAAAGGVGSPASAQRLRRP